MSRTLSARVTAVVIILLVASLFAAHADAQRQSYLIRIFRERDELTLYIPGNRLTPVNGLSIEVMNSSGEASLYFVEVYSAFRDLPFERLLTPVCFRMVRSGSNPPLEQVCQEIPANRVFTQTIPDEDVFWFDSEWGNRNILIIRRGNFREICRPVEAWCDVVMPVDVGLPDQALATATPRTVTRSATPDAGSIVYVSRRDGDPDIYGMNPDGSVQQQLLETRTTESDPKWSPDGLQIAFSAVVAGRSGVYIMNADGSDVRAVPLIPLWYEYEVSPDGREIVFAQQFNNGYEIVRANDDGTNRRRLTSNTHHDGSPTWSPDGTTIAFVSAQGGNYDIYVMNADGSNVRRLTTEEGSDSFPTWSPDGTQIAFASNRDGNYDIYVMNADGSNVRRLTKNPQEDTAPDWRP
jgi:hypothetical protein